MGEPYSGCGAAAGTGSEGDVGDASVNGAAWGGVAEGGVGDALGVGAGHAGGVVGDAPVVSACSVCEGATGGVMAGVALMRLVWVVSVWAAPSLMPPVGVVQLTVHRMPLVCAVRLSCRALVVLVTLMVTLVSVELRVLASLATPMVRALLVVFWQLVPVVVLRW